MSWDQQADLTWGAKQAVLAEYFDRFPRDVVIETGCWNGQGSCLQFAHRATVYVIEHDPGFCELARSSPWTVIEGDSATELPALLRLLDRPAFFWLDAHLVAEAGEENHSPLLEELDAILAWPHAAQSVLLIDDVRMMGRDGWPTIEEILSVASSTWQDRTVADIVRFTPLDSGA